MPRWVLSVVTAFLLSAIGANAQDQALEVKASFIFNKERIKISRDTATTAQFVSVFAAPGDACGAPCIAPMEAVPDARQLLVYDNGPISNEAGLLIGHLLDAGYSPEMISYARGGMQVWAVLGFSIEEGSV